MGLAGLIVTSCAALLVLTTLAFEIKAGQADSGVLDLGQYAAVGLYPLRQPDGGHLVPLVLPRLEQEDVRGGGPLDAYMIALETDEGAGLALIECVKVDVAAPPQFITFNPRLVAFVPPVFR